MPLNKSDLIDSLGILGYPVLSTPKKQPDKTGVIKVLNALAESDDLRLIEGFPVVIANWAANRKSDLDVRSLLSMSQEDRKKREFLEKLLLISSELLSMDNLKQPAALEILAKSLKNKYGNLLSGENVSMGNNVHLSVERLVNTLRRYTVDLAAQKAERQKNAESQRRSFQLNLNLSTLFSSKQKDLVFKKYKGEPLTKTEQEYYSRVVKKKVMAIADSEIRKIITALSKK